MKKRLLAITLTLPNLVFASPAKFECTIVRAEKPLERRSILLQADQNINEVEVSFENLLCVGIATQVLGDGSVPFVRVALSNHIAAAESGDAFKKNEVSLTTLNVAGDDLEYNECFCEIK